MTIAELCEKLDLKCYTNNIDCEREVEGFYIGDLLSWVMGRAKPDAAWLTIMNNVNVAAVALMIDAACVILCEGVAPDDALAKKAAERGICILLSDKDAYTLAVETVSGP